MRVLRGVLRWGLRLAGGAALLLTLLFLAVFHRALYHRFVTFPAEAQAWQAIRADRTPVELRSAYREFRGALHAHSERSHDSEISYEQIAQAARDADIQFIFMSDHCVEGKADYSQGWKGVDSDSGVLFVRGYEMSHGFMPWGLPDDVTLDCGAGPEALAEQIAAAGGALFFAHTEQERRWDLPQLSGMEIYNIHTDFKDESLIRLLPDLIVSLRAYPDQSMRLIFDRQTAILARWDELNRDRKIVGIAANDAHQNNGVRGYYTKEGRFLLKETGPKGGKEFELNPLTRLLLRLAFGPLEPDRLLFRIDVDPYAKSLRFVNTHILADELTEEALLEGLKTGRVFIGFDMIADARGFLMGAWDGERLMVMGESAPLRPGLEIRAAAPHECRFTLWRDGSKIQEGIGRTFSYAVDQAGKYRVEAELDIRGKWIPWVYTNPVEITKGGEASYAHPTGHLDTALRK